MAVPHGPRRHGLLDRRRLAGLGLVAADHAALLGMPMPGRAGLVGRLARHPGGLLRRGGGVAGALGLALSGGGGLREPATGLLHGARLLPSARGVAVGLGDRFVRPAHMALGGRYGRDRTVGVLLHGAGTVLGPGDLRLDLGRHLGAALHRGLHVAGARLHPLGVALHRPGRLLGALDVALHGRGGLVGARDVLLDPCGDLVAAGDRLLGALGCLLGPLGAGLLLS